jgi:hypothetical protein
MTTQTSNTFALVSGAVILFDVPLIAAVIEYVSTQKFNFIASPQGFVTTTLIAALLGAAIGEKQFNKPAITALGGAAGAAALLLYGHHNFG